MSPQSHGVEAGIAAFQNDEHWYFLAVGDENSRRTIRVRRRAGGSDPAAGAVLASVPSPRETRQQFELRINAHGAAYDFSWSAEGRHWHSLLRNADGTVLSTKRSGGFVGAVFGLYAHDESSAK